MKDGSVDVQALIEVFEESMDWWTPMGEYYAPNDRGETYDRLVREFFAALNMDPPEMFLEEVKQI